MPGKTKFELLYHKNSPERYRSGRNGVDSKSICPVNSGARGFESHPLRQKMILTPLPSQFSRSKRIYGEMSELAEGARLEIACTTNSGTEGSNPSLSANYTRIVDFFWTLCHAI